jgi:hypothetical protein
MKPTIPNAFTKNPRKSLASSLSRMQADLRETPFGWSLELSPMFAADAFTALCDEGDEITPATAGQSLLVQVEQSEWQDSQGNCSIESIADRLAIPAIERFSEDQLLLDELSLRQLVNTCRPTRLLVVRVNGSLEARDVAAINRALEAGQSPLTAELCAEMALEVTNDRSVVLHVRDKNMALRVVAENFRHYLAAVRGRAVSEFAAPEVWQIERVLSLSGSLTIRPIETEVLSTSIDVGINTAANRASRPADRSLIYDIPSNSWHDEP